MKKTVKKILGSVPFVRALFLGTVAGPATVQVQLGGADQGVAGALADPVIELHAKDGSLITSNDNRKKTQQTQIEATGAALGNGWSQPLLHLILTVSP